MIVPIVTVGVVISKFPEPVGSKTPDAFTDWTVNDIVPSTLSAGLPPRGAWLSTQYTINFNFLDVPVLLEDTVGESFVSHA